MGILGLGMEHLSGVCMALYELNFQQWKKKTLWVEKPSEAGD